MRRLFIPLATLILLVAAFVRLWQLHDYPPGPHYDEAAYLLITRSIAFGGARPFPIVEAYQGREVLYMYLNAPLLHLLGDNIFTMHVANAFYNLLTVAASLALGRAMFRGRRGIVIGLVVGVLIALNFPQIWLGRQAFRAVTLPMCQAFALLFLFRGLQARRGGWRWLLAGGIFAGLALYTYMASRLFPLWLALGGLALLIADWRNRGARLRQGVVFFGALAITALPMGIYAIQKPDIFMGRLTEVTQADQSITLAESLVVHARMFFIEGEAYLRYNIPGRPYLTLPEGLFMLVGVGVALWRLLRPGNPVARAAYALALLSPLMVIPSVISVGGLPPNHMRSLGMVPLIFVLVAVGVEFVLSRLLPVLQSEQRYARVFAIALVAVLLVGGGLVTQTYFAWAGRADVYYESDADLAAAAAWLPAQVDENTIVYLAARDRGHPTVMIADTPPVTWLGMESLFRAPSGYEGLYIFPRSAPPAAQWTAWLEPGRVEGLPLGPDGRTAFEAFRISGDAALPIPNSMPENSVENQYLDLIGVHLSPISAGGRGEFFMDWQVKAPPPFPDLTPLVQLEDEYGAVLYRADVYITETDRWRAGEVLMQRIRLRVPAATAPGRYALRVAWVGKASNQYVPYANGSVWATVGELEVIRPSEFPDPADLPIQVRDVRDVLPDVRLLGWNMPLMQARPGESLRFDLFWQGLEGDSEAAPRYTVRLVSGEGSTTLISDAAVGGHYPVGEWQAGELVRELLPVTIPREQPEGEYEVRLDVGGEQITLGQLSVTGLPRTFDAPPMQTSLDVMFGEQIALRGFNLATRPGGFTLDLLWHALRNPEANYTVFVHVLDAQGNIVTQRDNAPQGGHYPTSLWIEGEYVTDTYRFDALPPGEYALVAGLYSQETGERLPAQDGRMVLVGRIVQLATVAVSS